VEENRRLVYSGLQQKAWFGGEQDAAAEPSFHG
jgi:hypothetical protein